MAQAVKLSQMLEDAKAKLIERGWRQGHRNAHSKGLCMSEACSAVCAGYTNRNSPVHNALAMVLPADGDNDQIAMLVRFNDARGRTRDEVLERFDFAICDAREDEARRS